MREEWLISMTAGRWQIGGILEAKKMGYKVLGIDADHNAQGFVHCDKALTIDIYNKESLISAIRKLNLNIKGIFSYCSEAGMTPSSWLVDEFKLSGLSEADVSKFIRKNVQRKIWMESQAETLKWKLVDSANQANEVAQEIGYPVIIKPIDSSGSRGVSKVLNREELMIAFKKAIEFSKSKNVIIEEFLDGVEYTVESITENKVSRVLLITEKNKVEGSRGTVASELSSPTVSESILKLIEQKVLNAIAALDYTDGVTHTEVIVTKKGVVGLVEMAARGGGFGLFSKLIPAATGIDVTKLYIQQSLGQSINLSKLVIHKKFFSLKFFPVTQSGVIKAIKGLEAAKEVSGVDVESFVGVGDKVSHEYTDGSRLGYILVTADKVSDISFKIKNVETLVQFEVSSENY